MLSIFIKNLNLFKNSGEKIIYLYKRKRLIKIISLFIYFSQFRSFLLLFKLIDLILQLFNFVF